MTGDLFAPAGAPVTTLKAISLWQPWASLWLTDRKIHETRHWPTRYRGWILVHAAKRPPDDDFLENELETICAEQFGRLWRKQLPCGALLGMVRLVDCVKTNGESMRDDRDDYHCGDFSPGRYAWRRDEARLLGRGPIPYRGSQGFFDVDVIALGIEVPA